MPTVTMTFEYTDEAERFALGQALGIACTKGAFPGPFSRLPVT